MGKPTFSDEFDRDVVTQITERGYPPAPGISRPCEVLRIRRGAQGRWSLVPHPKVPY